MLCAAIEIAKTLHVKLGTHFALLALFASPRMLGLDPVLKSLGDGLIAHAECPRDSSGRHAQTPQFASSFGKILIGKRLACIVKREAHSQLGNGSNRLRLRPPFQL